MNDPLAATEAIRSADPYAQLYYLVGHLRVYEELLVQGLRDEFYHKEEIVRDWRRQVRALRSSDVLVRRFLEGMPPQGHEDFLAKNWARLTFHKQKVEAALGALVTDRMSPVRDLFAALDRLFDAAIGLRVWQKRLCHDADRDLSDMFDTADERAAYQADWSGPELDKEIRQFRATVGGDDDLARCMASRRLLLAYSRTMVLCPQVCTAERLDTILRLHDRALEITRGTRELASMEKRLAIFRCLDVSSFTQRAKHTWKAA